MTVNLDSIIGTPTIEDGEQVTVPNVATNISNGTWMAIVTLARVFEPDTVPAWNGCHDGQEWTPAQLTIMADRLQQCANQIEILRELAKNGGVKIS